jgi:hypothetical protein
MHHECFYAKHVKGNPPPFQKSKRGLDDWMRSLRSLDQHPYNLSDIQSLKQCVVSKIDFSDRESDNVSLYNEQGLGEEYRTENE